MKALVLALGAGRGMQPWRGRTPAPLLPVRGEPVLVHTLRWLTHHRPSGVAVAIYRQAAEIREAIDAEVKGIDLLWSQETEPHGTARAAAELGPFLDETFVVVYGNLLVDVDLTALLDYHRARHALATIGLVHTDDPAANVMVECDSAGAVVRLAVHPTTWTDERRTASAGIFVVEPEVLARIPDDRPFDWESHLFPVLVADGDPIFAQLLGGTVVDAADL